jgi:hypothetical protein
MTFGEGKAGRTINLDSDESIRETIARAAAGHKPSAWFLIYQLETVLRERRVSGPLFDYAADFLAVLQDIDDTKDGRATPRDLVKAFDKLHIVHKRGQPQREDECRTMLAARVVLLRQTGFSTDKALGVLDAFEGQPRTAYRTAYDERGDLFERHSVTAELEAMAGVSQAELLRALLKSGSITRAEFQLTQSATKPAAGK